jgi:DNA polymerase
MLVSFDMEVYSEAGYSIDPVHKKVRGTGPQNKGGLPEVGTPVYAEHPSTDVICVGYDLQKGKGKQLWTPAMPPPIEFLNHVASGGLVEAWNITFEFYIWNLVLVPKYGWPTLSLSQCRCAMARSRRFGLPGSLEKASSVLGLEGKDKEGKRLIQKLTRPHTPTKKRPDVRWDEISAQEDYMAMYRYCLQDVEAEDAVAMQIPELSPDELATWQMDQVINLRGVAVDTESLDAALDILKKAVNRYTLELVSITEGAVGSVGEVAKIIDWCRDQGVSLKDLTKDSVSAALEGSLPDSVRRVLEIRKTLGLANVKKLLKLKSQVSRDGRLRDQYVYCGAGTGRASSGGVQMQNIRGGGPRSYDCNACGRIIGDVSSCPCGNQVDLDARKEWTVDAVEWALKDLKTGDLETVVSNWGDPVALLCGCLRGLFWSQKDEQELICCDFTSIEAVVLACLSRCQWRIDAMTQKKPIYLMSAAKICNRTVEEYLEYYEKNGDHHPDRKIGKVAELACGYSGWIGAWKVFDKTGRTDAEIKNLILSWREDSPEIVEFWGGQFRKKSHRWEWSYELYGLEGAAISAILNPNQEFHVGDITYVSDTKVLYCILPSGRKLNYHRPRVALEEDRFGRGACYRIMFEGYNSNPDRGPVGWIVQDTYGGKLAENCSQAVAADIQFDAIKRLESDSFPVVMHTHDEVTAEIMAGSRTLAEMKSIMERRPAWAQWWPIRAEGWIGRRYRKD